MLEKHIDVIDGGQSDAHFLGTEQDYNRRMNGIKFRLINQVIKSRG